MNGRLVLSFLLALVLIAGVVGIGVYAYNMGVAQGMAADGKLITPPTGVVPFPYYGPFFFHPFGFGFLSCLFPLFFFLLFFALLRGIFWRGAWGGHHRHWDKGVPPPIEEWHRKMHEPQSTEK